MSFVPKTRVLLVPAAILGLAACGETLDTDNNNNDDTTGLSCSVDFDCQVGQVCGTDSLCEVAGANATRVFGQADLTFAADEAFLVTVFALPTGATAPDDFSPFTLEGVTSEPNALRIRERKYAGIDYSSRPYWQARLATSAARRQTIRELAEGMERGEREVFGVRPFQATTCDCDALEVCNPAGMCVTSLPLSVGGTSVTANVAGTVTGTSIEIKVLVDASESGTGAASLDAATAFVDAAEEVLFVLGEDSGHAGALDRDGSGALNVFFSESLPSLFSIDGLAGLFDVGDFLPAGDPAANGNEMDLLVAVPPTTGVDLASCQTNGCTAGEIPFEFALATLSHEYQHLVSFARRAAERDTLALSSQETLWLDEGLSHTIEDLVGYGNSTQEVVAQLFSEFDTENRWAVTEDSIALRGMAYTLIRHIIDQRARSAGATDAASPETRTAARSVYSELLSSPQDGYLHPLFQNLGAAGISDWLVALYATDNPDVTETLTNQFLPPGTATGSGLTIGFSPFIETIDSRGVDLTLEGPILGDGDSDILDDLSSATESEIAISQALYFEVEGLTPGEFTLRASGDANIDLRFRVDRIR